MKLRSSCGLNGDFAWQRHIPTFDGTKIWDHQIVRGEFPAKQVLDFSHHTATSFFKSHNI